MFRKIATLALIGAMTLPASLAVAADLDRGSNTADVGSSQPFSWTGFYLGGRIGYGNANHKIGEETYFNSYCGDEGQEHGFEDHDKDNRSKYLVNGTLVCDKNGPDDNSPNTYDTIVVNGQTQEIASVDGINSSGITGGFQVGFDKQIGTRLIVGVFGSYDLSSMETNVSALGIEIPLIEKGDEWSIGARFGYLLHPRVMAYVLAAYTQADWEFVTGDIGDDGGRKEITFDGVTVGGGLEYAVTRNIFLGIEGTHTFYGKEAIVDEYSAESNIGSRTTDEIGETKVLGTLKIKGNPFDGNLGILD